MATEISHYRELFDQPRQELESPPLYEKKGDLFCPNEFVRGPWFAEVQHGGAIVALLARGMEELPAYAPMRITSLNVEMFRKVPLEPVQIRAHIVRDGKRIGALAASMFDATGEVELARAQALRIRMADGVVAPEQVPPPYGEDLEPAYFGPLVKMDMEDERFSFTRAFEAWRDEHDFTGGKGSSWWRLKYPLVDDEPLSPLVRVGATTDLIMSANGILGSEDSYISVNPNLFISMQRDMDGEWLCLESTVRIDAMGTGETDAVLYDHKGRIGKGIKALLIDKSD